MRRRVRRRVASILSGSVGDAGEGSSGTIEADGGDIDIVVTLAGGALLLACLEAPAADGASETQSIGTLHVPAGTGSDEVGVDSNNRRTSIAKLDGGGADHAEINPAENDSPHVGMNDDGQHTEDTGCAKIDNEKDCCRTHTGTPAKPGAQPDGRQKRLLLETREASLLVGYLGAVAVTASLEVEAERVSAAAGLFASAPDDEIELSQSSSGASIIEGFLKNSKDNDVGDEGNGHDGDGSCSSTHTASLPERRVCAGTDCDGNEHGENQGGIGVPLPASTSTASAKAVAATKGLLCCDGSLLACDGSASAKDMSGKQEQFVGESGV